MIIEKSELNNENITVGSLLKQYRIENNITVKDVAEYLKVKESDILNLENDSIYNNKPAIYIRGLKKSYIKFLKINDKLLETISNIEIRGKAHLIENERYHPSKKQLIYALLLLFISYIVFFHNFSEKNYLTDDFIIEKINSYDTQF